MTLARRLLRGMVGAGATPQSLIGLYNGRSAAALYAIGVLSSTDGGLNWTKHVGNPVLSAGSGWESSFVVDPSLIHDGTQYVCYYAGYDGTHFRIGRATSPDGTTWTKYGSNPVLDLGAGGNFDDYSVNFPTVLYDPAAVHPWQMWYTGWPDGTAIDTTIGYAYSSDGLAWTRVARMLDVGGAGAFDEKGLATGPVLRIGGTYYVYYAGFNASSHYHTGYATTTDPTSAAAYAKQGVISALSGDVGLAGGITCHSNQLRSLLAYGATYRGLVSCFHPPSGPDEYNATITATDLATFAAPVGPMPPLGGAGAWDDQSAENASALYV